MNKLRFWWAALFLGVTTSAAAQDPLEDSQTAISGTDEADDIDVAPAADAAASISTEEGGKLSATATGVDARDGNDSVNGSIAVTTSAIAAANLLDASEKTEATATAVGVDAGNGDDQVNGALAFTSTASASGLFAGDIEYQPPATPPDDEEEGKKLEVTIATEASATGVKGGDGEDEIGNDALFAVTALATSGGSSSQFSATVEDSTSFKAVSESTATATGIASGDGSDQVTNDGLMTNVATATSGALAVALVAPKDENAPAESAKNQIKSDATAKSTATATGIESADDSKEDSSEEESPWELDGLKVTYHKTVTNEGADDTVTNNVALVNTALATSGAGAGGISNKVDGSMEATASAEAKAESAGISSGVGSDTITNNGELLSNATASAGALSVTIEVGTPSEAAPTPDPGEKPEPAKPSEDKENKSKTSTNVTAEAEASGINADGSGTEEVTDGFVELSNGRLVADYRSTTNTIAGNDVVTNAGAIQAIAGANAGSASAGVTQSSGGSSSSEAKSTATSKTHGITTGGGNDTVTNSGVLTVSASSDASAINAGIAVGMPAEETPGEETEPDTESDKVTAETSTEVKAEAEAVGIDTAGESNGEVTRHAELHSGGLSVQFGESRTAAIDDDVVVNDGIMTTTATAKASAADASVALDAVGSVSSDASATATASSNGISTGAGNDTVTNNFLFTANSTATAEALSIAVTASKPSTGSDGARDETNVKVKAGATAEAATTGIDAEGSGHETSKNTTISIAANGLDVVHTTTDVSHAGADRVTNNGTMIIGATSSSTTVGVGATIGVAGSVDADTTSKADATSRAIHTGGGGDVIENGGIITSIATADAQALALSLSVAQPDKGSGTEPPAPPQAQGKGATMNGAANAEATAVASAIDAEGTTHSNETENSVHIGLDGFTVVLRTTHSSVAGDDELTNTGALTSTATSTVGAGAAGIAIQSEGTASADTKASARSTSGAVLTGGGSDDVTNQGALLATATSTAGALSVSFSQSNAQGSKAKSEASATSDARAVGIGTGSEGSTRERVATIDITTSGITFDYSDETQADDGTDTVVNQGAVVASSTATSGAFGAAIAIDGTASADVTAESSARTEGIDLGAGDDDLTNDGLLTASATSTSGALAVAFGQNGTESKPGENEIEATAKAESEATGIRADSGANASTLGSLILGGSGIQGHLDYSNDAAGGNDTVVNRGGIGVAATSTAGAGGAAIAIDGAAKADVDSEASSRATAIDGGGGDDDVHNEGEILAVADSTAATVAVSVKVGEKTSTGNAKVEASSTSTASSAGISTDGSAVNASVGVDLTINSAGLDLAVLATSAAESGNDKLTNLEGVVARASADSGAGSVAFAIKGTANANTNSTASASAAALDTGAGADEVDNEGALEAHADAHAYTLNAAITNEGTAVANSGLMGAGTSAKARAAGITTQGMEEDTSVDAELHIVNDSGVTARLEFVTDGVGTDGEDTVINSGSILVDSVAEAPRLNVGITGKGLAVSMGRASTESRSSGIETGHLDDVIENSGEITATTSSTATLVNAAVSGKGGALALNAVWDGGTEATAVATGIDADSGERTSLLVEVEASADLARVRYTKEETGASGNDSILNSAAILAEATAAAPSLNLAAVTGTGLAAAVSTSTAGANAFGLRGGDGDDTIENSGDITSITDATAATANISYSNSGAAVAADAVWNGGTKATANSIGIAGDGGERSRKRVISIGTDGISIDDDSVDADGADTIRNSGAVGATANALAASASVAVTGSGVAAATATSTATANASAIDAGSGASIDDVENSGALTALANSDAYAASIAVTNNGVSGAVGAVWDGGTEAHARARGIDVGAGGEVVTNSGDMDIDSDANTLEASVAVTMNGVAAATATSSSHADATAIDASAGDDTDLVTNSGFLDVLSEADAVTASLSFTNNGVSISADAVWDGGTTANARARGIDTGAAGDEIENTGGMLVKSDGATVAIAAAGTVNGGAGAIATSTVNSNAAAIDAGNDDVRDVVTNSGDLEAIADSTAITATVSFAMTGLAVSSDAPWDGGTGAMSLARGVDVGLGSDQIDNTGDVTADANAAAVSGSVAVSVTGAAGGLARATADSNAIALDAGDGAGDDIVNNSGALVADSDATSAAVAASFTGTGVAVSYVGGSNANAVASAVRTGAGVDSIDNAGAITSHGDARAVGVSVSVTATGVTAAVTKAESDAIAFGIDAGDGNDSIENSATLDVDAISHATAVNVALVAGGAAIAADSAWDGGTTANASASGLSGGAGDDTIATRTAAGTIDSYAHAQTESVSVSVTGVGFAASVSTSTANADATALDGGAGRDIIVNDSEVTGSAEADATSVSVAVAFEGVAVAADAFWDGGTKANTDAKALSGGDGDDDVFNEGAANAIAHSETLSAQVAATFGATIGLSAAAAASMSTADAYSLSGGAGDDQLVNNGSILARSDAVASGISVSFTPQGLTAAGAFDAGTRGHSSATAMSGDDGTDTLVNAEGSTITLDASSQVLDLAASMTFAGVAAVNSNAEVNTHGFGLDGGAGEDTLINAGTIDGDIDATSTSAAVSLVGAGGAVVFANSTANAGGAGQTGGSGNDLVGNTGSIDLDFNTNAIGLSAGLTLAGGVWSQANADSIIDGNGLQGDAGEDEVINAGSVTIDANATVSALSVAVAAVGASGASANSVANSSSTGLSGGADADALLNDTTGVVDVHAGAILTSNSVSVTLTGGAFADARAAAEVSGAGLAGGDGDDGIENRGAVLVTAASRGTTTGFSLNATGAAFANTGVESNARAIGIDGGNGDDNILNAGSIDVGPVTTGQWMSFLQAESTGVSITGFADAQASTLARTRSAGIDGGAGADELWNTGEISVLANALTEATADSINVFGSANGGGESGAFTQAIGMEGASGDDLVASLGTLSVSAGSRLYRNGTSFSFAGGSSAESELVAETEALGLGGGDGADEIATEGSITINAGSTLESEGGGTTVFGASSNAGKSGSMTLARGIDGGAGDDLIDSNADLTINASSHLDLDSSNYTVGGAATSFGTLAAITESFGITGGAGADSIGNGGVINILAESELDSVGDSETTFGEAGSFAISGGISRATGLSGGDGNDILENRAGGEVHVSADVDVYTESVGYVFVGAGPTAGAVLTGNADVTGMNGDDGNDELFNRGTISVSSHAELFAKGGTEAEVTGLSQPESTGSADVAVFAQGLRGGGGDDFLGSLGEIEVRATGVAAAFNDATTGTFSVVNDNEAGTRTHARATATGFDGGDGTNRTEISNNLTVLAESTSHGLASSSGATLTLSSGAVSRTTSIADATATGIAGLGGDDSVLINADVSVTATSSTAKQVNLEVLVDADIRPVPEDGELLPPDVIEDDSLPPVADYLEHDVVFWASDHCVGQGSGQDPPTCQEPDNLPGEVGGHYQLQQVPVDPDGAGPEPPVNQLQWVFLEDGLVQPHLVTISLGSFASYSAANGSGLSGEGDAQGTANAIATAHGLNLAGGNNAVDQDGALTVQATAQGVMHTSADGDGIEGDSVSNATAFATATAVGLEFGDGDDVVRLRGDVTVTAIPIAQARAHASADDICIWFFGWWCGDLGDSYSDATTESHGVAAGIRAGGGNNAVTIDGSLTVISRPDIRNLDSTGEYSGSAIGEDRQNVIVTSTSSARGIDTGSGDDEIVNNGAIAVEAWDLGSACDGTSCGGIPAGVDSVAATGIMTGAGNDIVRNFGSIRVETIANDVRTSTLAIDTGDGDDQLHLGGGSSIVGSVSLGAGDDTLELRGTPTITNSAGTMLDIDAGGGLDTMVLNGLGSYAGSPQSIESAIKREAGTYTLASLNMVELLRIEDGTLRVNCCYTFSPTGTFETYFNVNGDSGVLSLAGNATLNGAVSVERRGDTFIANGTRYNIIHADGTVSGDFTEVTLPESRPLLGFMLEQGAQDVDVVAVAPSFSTVTDNPLYGQIAVNLDDIADGSGGELAELFGSMQTMNGGFDRALASFSPDTHLATSGSVLTNLREMTRTLQGHLGDSRVRYRHVPHARMPEASLSFRGGSGGLGTMQLTPGRRLAGMADLPPPPEKPAAANGGPRTQAWMLGIGADGKHRTIEGYSAFDTDTRGFMFGADRKGDNWLAGATLGQASTDIVSGDLSSGKIDAWLASAYATWFDENLYFETGLTVGKQDFKDRRILDVAGDLRTAESKHGGKAWSAFMAGGFTMDYGGFEIEPYLSLDYFEAGEDGFEETGAGTISQVIGKRDGNAFIGEAGANFSYRHEWARGLIDWHGSLGISHDFGVDTDPLSFHYVGVPGSQFAIDGRPMDESATLYGLGVSFIGDLSALALDWRGLEDSYRRERFVSASISLRF